MYIPKSQLFPQLLLRGMILGISLFILTKVPAQTPSFAKQAKELDKYIEKALEDWKVPALGLAIVKNGEVLYTKGYGYRNLEDKIPADSKTLFAIGSSSKAFTAATVVQLADDDKLDLDEPVKTYLPDFQLFDEVATKEMTARDLLSHRSGLPRHDFVWYGSDKSRKQLYESLKHLEPTASFRQTWQYQNLMFMTAGYLVEELSGMSWEAFTKARIFDPLEMNNSNFSVEDMKKSDNAALPYREKEGEMIQMKYRNIDAIGPAGSINSNVEDMSKWVIMQLNGGKYGDEEVVSSSGLTQMHSPTMIMPGSVSDEVFYRLYGLGWMITSYRGHLRVEHGGNIDGFSANVGLFPRDSIGIVVLTNMNGTRITGAIRNYVFDKLVELEEIDWSQRLLGDIEKAKKAQEEVESDDVSQVKGTNPAHPLEQYAGKYEHPAYGLVSVIVEDGKMSVKLREFDMAVEHYHYETFQADHDLLGKQKFTFITNEKGEIANLSTVLQLGVDPIEFERVVEAMEIATTDLEKYIGDYEIASVTLKIALESGTLTMTVPGQPVYDLVPTKEHEFQLKNMDGFKVIFTIDFNGNVDGLISSQPNGDFKAKRK